MRPVVSTFFAAMIMLAGASALSAQTQADEKVFYYLGEVKMTSPAGRPFGSSVSLVKRTLTPAENKIVELVASLDARQPAKEYTTVFDIKGNKFTVKDNEGTFSGSGELVGTSWGWTGWNYSVDMLGERKGKLAAEDHLTADGLVDSKTFAGPDGKPQVLFSEALKPISKEMYEILHAKLFPPKS